MIFLLIFLICIACALRFYLLDQQKYAFYTIIALCVIPRLHLINNPSLGNHDEKYHALVAKHLIEEPLIPKLYQHNPLPFNHGHYSETNIWLSKPPVALWLMSSSIYLFGAHPLSVRLWSLLLAIAGIIVLQRLARQFLSDKSTTIAIFLYAIHGTLIELGAGELSSDHVDVCFNFLFLLTVFLATKQLNNPENINRHYITIGILSALLFLTKWYVALLIIPIITYCIYNNKQTLKSKINALLTISIAAIITAFPWLLYIYTKHPSETISIIVALISPVANITQGHTGQWYYYLDKIGKLYGEFVYLPLLALPYLIFTHRKKHIYHLLTIWIFIPLLLFSIAETKRFTYLTVLAPAVFLLIAQVVTILQQSQRIPKYATYLLISGLIALPIRFSIERVDYFTDHQNRNRAERLWLATLNNFTDTIDEDNTVIFGEPKYIETMFYSNCISYQYSASQKDLYLLKSRGYECYHYQNGKYTPL